MRLGWTLLIGSLLGIVGVLLWEHIPIQHRCWVGGYDLTVHVEPSAGRIWSVHCVIFRSREESDPILQHLIPTRDGDSFAAAEFFTGEPLALHVKSSGVQSAWGRNLSHHQSRYLVVIAELESGKRVGRLVEIADSQREVTVRIP
jgi:hypothetical protein